MREGDRNTKFFHRVANGRKRRNQIEAIEDEYGVIQEEEEDIQKVFVNYFSGLFTAKSYLEMEEALEEVDNRVSEEMLRTLSYPFTEAEVTKALFQMHPSKAPGPDGMTANFFQKFWHVVRHDIISSCLSVLNDGVSPDVLNHTFIALIPKIKFPRGPADFCHISLCNVAFKIITKTMKIA